MMRGSQNYHIRDWCIDGKDMLILKKLILTLADFIGNEDVKGFYLGKASGLNCFDSLYARDDKYKRDQGLNLAIGIYKSSNKEYAKFVEELLIAQFFHHPKNINREFERPGRPSSGALHFVYVACRMWPAPREGEFGD